MLDLIMKRNNPELEGNEIDGAIGGSAPTPRKDESHLEDDDLVYDDEFYEKKYTLYNDLPNFIRDALEDPHIQDVMVNPGGDVYFHKEGRQYKAGTMTFNDMLRFCRKAGKAFGRQFGPRNPILSAILPNNERLEAIYPTLSTDGLTFALRRPGRLWTLEELLEKKSLTKEQADVLRETAHTHNQIVSGWIGAGKTTLVRAILAEGEVKKMRRVSIETDPEVQRPLNGVRLVASDTHDFDALFKPTLRLNTQLIVFSEVRTPAHVWALIEGVSTGHISKTTIHARDPLAAAQRMHRMVQRVSYVSPEDIAMACEIVAHIAPTGDGNRKVTEIIQVSADGDGFVAKRLA